MPATHLSTDTHFSGGQDQPNGPGKIGQGYVVVAPCAAVQTIMTHMRRVQRSGLRRPLSSSGLRASDVGRYLAHEFLEVAQALQPVDDYRVVDLDVVMDEYVAEPHGFAHRDGQLGCENPVFSEQPDGVAVVGRRPPALCRADVLRDIDTSLNRGNEGVLHAAQPDGILTALLGGSGFLPEDGSVVGNAPEQPQDAIFVYHALPAPAGDTGRELPVRAGDARELVKVNLPGGSLPPDPADRIIIEEQPAVCRYPPGQLQRSMVEYQQVYARRHQDVERIRRLAAEVCRDVDVRIRTVLSRDTTAMQVGEPRPGLPEHSSGLRHHLCCPGFIHLPSLADHWSLEPNDHGL